MQVERRENARFQTRFLYPEDCYARHREDSSPKYEVNSDAGLSLHFFFNSFGGSERVAYIKGLKSFEMFFAFI